MSERASPDARSIAVLIPVFNDDGQLDATLAWYADTIESWGRWRRAAA